MDDTHGAELIEGIRIVSIPNCGHGLVATRAFDACERLFAASAFGLAGSRLDDCCHMCFAMGGFVPRRCQGCPTVYCSETCRRKDERINNHSRCCASLARLDGDATASRQCKSQATFLLRALATRHGDASSRRHDHGAAQDGANSERMLPWPTFADAMAQCAEAEGSDGWSDEREAERLRVLRLTSRHGGKALVSPKEDALGLLRRIEHNVYTLNDGDDVSRGWAMYPGTSYINHSHLPNAVGIMEGWDCVRIKSMESFSRHVPSRIIENSIVAARGFCMVVQGERQQG